MYKRKRAGNTITRKINSTKDTAAKADKNHYISNSYLEGFIPIDTEYFTASCQQAKPTGRKTYIFFTVYLTGSGSILIAAAFSSADEHFHWFPHRNKMCIWPRLSSVTSASTW